MVVRGSGFNIEVSIDNRLYALLCNYETDVVISTKKMLPMNGEPGYYLLVGTMTITWASNYGGALSPFGSETALEAIQLCLFKQTRLTPSILSWDKDDPNGQCFTMTMNSSLCKFFIK